MKICDDLRAAVLQAAIQGKLTKQLPEDGDAADLLKTIVVSDVIDGRKVKKKAINEIDFENLPFDVPDSWTWTKLGDICVVARGGSPRPIKSFLTNSPDGLNWIKIGDTDKNGKYINTTAEKITPEGLKKSRMVHPGDFLLTNSMSFGRPYITNIEGCIHDGWLVISQQTEIYNQDFLYYLLSSNFAYTQFSGKVSGAVVQNLNSDKVADSTFPLPPLAEQHRIVARVDELMAKIDELEKVENQLETLKEEFPGDMKDAILQAAMQGRLTKQLESDSKIAIHADTIEECYETFELPKSWQWNVIDSVIDVSTGLTFNKQDQVSRGENTLRVLRGGNILDNYKYGLFDNDVYVTYREKYTALKIGDVLSPAVTSMEKMCKTAYIDKELEKTTAGGFVYILRAKDINILDPKYMMYFFSSWFNRFNCNENIHKSGQAFYNLKKSGLITQPIPIPPIEEQKRIVEKLEQLLMLCESLKI